MLDPQPAFEVLGIAWSPDGKYLAVAGDAFSESGEGVIWIWSIPEHPTVATPSQTYTPQPTLTATPSFTPTPQLPPATSTFVPSPTNTPTTAPAKTPTPRSSTTRINLSAELYLDEHSSPENLGESNHPDYSYFHNDNGNGYVYHFGNEEWVVSQSWTRILPLNDVDTTRHIEGELRQHYIEVWRDRELLYSFPVSGGYQPHTLWRYENHWIFWFMDDWANQGRIVQDGALLNDLYNYDNAFSLFLLDDKPFFFFQRGKQFGISFNNQEILLPYSNISYGPVCCEGGGSLNPRGTNRTVGFYVQRGDSKNQYIEIGLR